MALKVVIVDDDIQAVDFLNELLIECFDDILVVDKVHNVTDGIKAINKSNPDLVLLDVEMPRMDGFEFATLVRNDEQFSHIPIIMITSRTGDKHRNRARNIGVNAYLGKPYQEGELVDNLQNLLGAKYPDHD